MLISDVLEIFKHGRIEIGYCLLLDLMTLVNFICLLSSFTISRFKLFESLQKVRQFLSSFVKSCGRSHLLDSSGRSTWWGDSFDLKTITGKMSCTLATIIKILSIDLDFKLGLTFEMIDACFCRHGCSSFRYCSTIGNRWLVGKGIEAILLGLLLFVIDLFELRLIMTFEVLFIVISLSDWSVVYWLFIRLRSIHFSKERLLNIHAFWTL